MGQEGAGDKGIQAASQYQKPGLAGMRKLFITACFAQTGIVRIRIGIGFGPFKILR